MQNKKSTNLSQNLKTKTKKSQTYQKNQHKKQDKYIFLNTKHDIAAQNERSLITEQKTSSQKKITNTTSANTHTKKKKIRKATKKKKKSTNKNKTKKNE